MARFVDLERRGRLLDQVVAHLARHGLANVSLRPMAAALGVSVNSLVHHFGSKDDLIIAALRRAGAVQQEVERRWLLVDEGVPRDAAVTEASLAKAMFTGLVVDLLATGQKARLTRALEVGLARLEQVVWTSAGLTEPNFPAAPRQRDRPN